MWVRGGCVWDFCLSRENFGGGGAWWWWWWGGGLFAVLPVLLNHLTEVLSLHLHVVLCCSEILNTHRQITEFNFLINPNFLQNSGGGGGGGGVEIPGPPP